MANKQIHTAIIGYGLSGKVFHAPFIHTHPGFLLQKIVERHSNESIKQYPYIETVEDYQNVIQDENIDLIIICTPNTSHYSMVKEGLLAGKHIVIEKPFTPTSQEADELIQIAQEQNKKLFVYHNRRWDGDFLSIKKILDEQLLGDIYEYEAHFDRYAPDLQGNWRDDDIAGGGILYDLGAHLIDQALNLFGIPKKMKTTIEAQRKNSKVDDYFRLEWEYEKLNVILTAGMFVKELGPRFILKGSKGVFTKYGIDPQEDALKNALMPKGENWGKERPEFWGKIDFTDGHTQTIESQAGNYMAFYDNVYDVIIKHAEMMIKPEEARDVIYIIETSFAQQRQ